MRISLVALAAALAALPARALPQKASAPFTALSLVGRAVLPRDLEYERTRVGGLSGLTWDAENGRFLAISDDRGRFGPVRVYRIRLDVAPRRDGRYPFTATASVDGMTFLTDAKGRPFVPSRLATEGIALLPGRLLVSTEAIARHGIPAAITEHAPDGRLRRELPLPAKLLPAPGRGVRDNLGFEGLAATPDGRYLFAGLENALEQDGAPADVKTPSPARLLRFDLSSGGLPAEFVYVVDPVSPPPPGEGLFRINGLSEILALGPDRLVRLTFLIASPGSEARSHPLLREARLCGPAPPARVRPVSGAPRCPPPPWSACSRAPSPAAAPKPTSPTRAPTPAPGCSPPTTAKWRSRSTPSASSRPATPSPRWSRPAPTWSASRPGSEAWR